MDQQNKDNSIKENLFEAIKNGDLAMRPRWHFVFKTVFAAIGAFVVFLAILYFVSLIFSALRESGVWFVPAFGWLGWIEFFVYLPWILVFAALFFIVVLEVLVRYFSFGRRQPVLYTALGVIIFALMGGILAEPYHRPLFRDIHDRNESFVSDFYRKFGMPRPLKTHVGLIFATTSEGFTLDSRDDEMINVVINSRTSFPFGIEFSKGDLVVVFGDRNDDIIEARGIREVNTEFASSSKQIKMQGSRQVFRF